MPEGMKTIDAIKEDGGVVKEKCKDITHSACEKVEEAAISAKEAMEPEEPTLLEKAKDKMTSAYESVKKATVG